MARPSRAVAAPQVSPIHIRWMAVAALAGLGFSAASAWVHYRILTDPFYASFCDVTATFSCTNAYTSRFGAIGGVPVAIIGVVYFAFVLLVMGLTARSTAARKNLPGYVFALATVGLAGVLYFAYASFFVLQAVCLLCVGTYASVLALFLLAGSAATDPMSSVPRRAARDVRLLLRTPVAIGVALAFLAGAAAVLVAFPREPAAAAASAAPGTAAAPSAATLSPPPPQPPVSDAAARQLEEWLAAQPREPVGTGGSGAAVVIVKFNDYQCPPCGQTYALYKPVVAQLQQRYPGKIAYITRDFPLDPECNALGGTHQAACEAAVAVRLAREQGRADAMEEWLFANQASLTPATVRQAAASVGNVSDFDARYPEMLNRVRGDIAQGVQLQVRGTPTFFMNGIRLQIFPPNLFEAAVEWELRRLGAGTD
jgi:uncharacterized membrane protein/predicted DsbA family dithiol-disulfide isomerase